MKDVVFVWQVMNEIIATVRLCLFSNLSLVESFPTCLCLKITAEADCVSSSFASLFDVLYILTGVASSASVGY